MKAINPESISYLEITRLLIVKPLIAFKLILEKNENMPQVIILGLFGLLNAITPVLLTTQLMGEGFSIDFKGAIEPWLVGFLYGSWHCSQTLPAISLNRK
ncbi:MAG: hypothetical protein MZV63_60780 [Marinilabiliales bacterium]|nr:hypothetical protein [Marinilabiliales bacterium]